MVPEGRSPLRARGRYVRVTPSVLIEPMALYDFDSVHPAAKRSRPLVREIHLLLRLAVRRLRRRTTSPRTDYIIVGGESVWLIVKEDDGSKG